MLIEKERIMEAKARLGDRNAEIMAELLDLQQYDEKSMKALCPFHEEDTPSFIYNKKAYSFRCFHADTKVITRLGTKRIGDIIGIPVDIINGNGKWETVIFRSYGKQNLMKLTLVLKDKQKVIYTTPEHEWFVHRVKHKIETKDLRPGQHLDKMWFHADPLHPDPEGVRHGFLFGDGTVSSRAILKGTTTYVANVYDSKKMDMCVRYFDHPERVCPSVKRDAPNCIGRVKHSCSYDAKTPPSIMMDDNYIFGFLAGYFIADGNASDDTVLISSANYDQLVEIRDLCTKVGFATFPIGHQKRTLNSNMGCVKLHGDHYIYTLRIAKKSIPSNFYLTNKRPATVAKTDPPLGYRVVSVEPTDRFEEVYCCVTSTHSFVLEDFILTGNCFGKCAQSYDLIDILMKTQNISYLEAVQELFKLAEMPYDFSDVGIHKNSDYKYPKPVYAENKNKVYEYWALRGISKETIDYADVQQDEDGNTLFQYYDLNDVLTMVKIRKSRKIAKGETKCYCLPGSDTKPLLFNMNKINTTQPLIIACGEGDALALIECGFRNTVSIPLGDGNTHWIEECYDFLQLFDEIYLCHDNDEAGDKYIKAMPMRLGDYRCKIVDIPKYYTRDDGAKVGIKDINELLVLQGKDAVIRAVNNAKESEIESIIDYTEVQEFDMDSMEGFTTGFGELDRMINKIYLGSLTVLTGSPSCGKSSFISTLALRAVEQGYPCLLYSGELSNMNLRNWLDYALVGQRWLNKIEGPNKTYFKVKPEAYPLINKYYKNKIYFYKDSFSQNVDRILEAFESAVRRKGVQVIFLDNFSIVDLGCTDDNKYEKQEQFVKKLIEFAKKFNVAVVSVLHPKKIMNITDMSIYDLSGTSAAVNLAHRIFTIYRLTPKDKQGTIGRGGKWDKEPIDADVKITCLKDRYHSATGQHFYLHYDVPSRRFYDTLENLDHVYAFDRNEYDNQLPYYDYEKEKREEQIFGKVDESA